jgi:hypothetical protein
MSETVDAPVDAPAAPAPADTPAADPAPAAAPADAAADWRAGLPEELRDAAALKKFNDPGALAKSYVELEKKIGQRGVTVPGEGAAPEEIAAYRKALGVPEKPDGYGLKVPEGVPEHAWNEASGTLLSNWAHDLALTPAQAQGLAERYAKMVADHAQQEAVATEEALRGEWGALYDRKVAAAARATKELLGPEAAAVLAEAGLSNNVHLLRALNRIGEAISPHDGSAGMGGGGAPSADPRAEIKALKASPAYEDALHPAHRETVARITQLYKRVV